jgi:hypothetical protein
MVLPHNVCPVFVLGLYIRCKHMIKFNVFHVCALYYTKNTNHQQMHKESFIINCSTLLHVSTLLGHLQGELSVVVTLRLHFIVE